MKATLPIWFGALTAAVCTAAVISGRSPEWMYAGFGGLFLGMGLCFAIWRFSPAGRDWLGID